MANSQGSYNVVGQNEIQVKIEFLCLTLFQGRR